jgi:hypothetical protein
MHAKTISVQVQNFQQTADQMAYRDANVRMGINNVPASNYRRVLTRFDAYRVMTQILGFIYRQCVSLGFGDRDLLAANVRFGHVGGVVGRNHHVDHWAAVFHAVREGRAVFMGAVEFQWHGGTPSQVVTDMTAPLIHCCDAPTTSTPAALCGP